MCGLEGFTLHDRPKNHLSFPCFLQWNLNFLRAPLIKLLLSVRSYCFSVAKSCPTLCDPVDCSTLSFPVLCLFKFMSIQLVILSNHISGDISTILLSLRKLSVLWPSVPPVKNISLDKEELPHLGKLS